MGLAPQQVGDMSLWQFMTCLEAHNRAHGDPSGPRPPTAEERRERLERTRHL